MVLTTTRHNLGEWASKAVAFIRWLLERRQRRRTGTGSAVNRIACLVTLDHPIQQLALQSKVAFVRFVLGKRHSDSGVEVGLFELAYVLRDRADVDLEQREELRDNLEWFEKQLPRPDRFNRSRSKGYYRRKTRGIAWFRDSATECIARMHQLKRILEANGHAVWIIREERVGYLVYEDDLQVIAEPFAETQTGG